MTLLPPIVPTVNRTRRTLTAALLTLVVATVSGCGGFSGRGSASPASFFLPGLMKVEPRPAPSAPGEATPVSAPFAEESVSS